MAKRNTKPATSGENVEMALLRRCHDAHPPTLEEFRKLREFRSERAAARAHDRAIARAVKAERDRCSAIAKRGFDGDIDPSDVWVEIVNGVTP